MAGERTLKALLQWALDKQSLDEVIKSIAPLERKLREVDKLAADVAKKLGNVDREGGAQKLTQNFDETKKAVSGTVQEVEKINQATQRAVQSTRQLASEAARRIPAGKAQRDIVPEFKSPFTPEQQAAFAERSQRIREEFLRRTAQDAADAAGKLKTLEVAFAGVAETSKRGELTLDEYLDTLGKVVALGQNLRIPQISETAGAAKFLQERGVEPPNEALRQQLGLLAETGDLSQDQLKIQQSIAEALDKQAATLKFNLSQEEQLWEVIKRIASSQKLTTRDAAQLLANYKGISKEAQGIATEIGTDPTQVVEARNRRLAEEAAKRAAAAAKENASEEEILAAQVNAVGRELNKTTKEAAEFAATMSFAGGKGAEELEKITRSVNKATKGANQFGQAMRFGIAGFTTQILGVQIETAVRPFFDLPGQFATFAGRSNEAAREWLNTSSQLEQSQMRIAQTIARAVLPAMEQLVTMVEQVASFAERNPELVQAVATGAVSLLAIGTTLKLLGFALSAFGTVKNLGGLLGLGKAAGTAAEAGGLLGGGGLLATATALLPALLPIVITAAVAYLGRFVTLPGQDKSVTEAAGGAIAQGVSVLGVAGTKSLLEILGIDPSATATHLQLVTRLLGEFSGALDDVDITKGDALKAGVSGAKAFIETIREGGSFEEAIAAMDAHAQAVLDNAKQVRKAADEIADTPIVPDAIISGIVALLRQLEQAEKQYEEDRAAIVEQYGEERAQLEENFEKQRNDLINDYNQRLAELYASYLDQIQDATEAFAKQDRRAEEDYYLRRLKVAEEFGKEIERLEEDHQDRLEKLRREHLIRVEDLVASRDALGLARELRRYEDERQQEEEEFEKDARRRNEDYADKIAEMEAQFALERARRREDFEDRLRELDEDYARQKAKLAQQHQDRLNQIAQQQAEQQEKLEEGIDEQLKLLDERYAKEKENLEKAIADQVLLAEALGLTSQNIQSIYQQAYEEFNRIAALRNQVLNQLQNIPNFGPPPAPGTGGGGGTQTYSFQSGGYISKDGYYRGHRKDFVLAPSTTSALEKGLGGSLTQDKLLTLASARNANNAPQTLRVVVDQSNWRIEGALTVAEKAALKKQMSEAAHEAIRAVVLG